MKAHILVEMYVKEWDSKAYRFLLTKPQRDMFLSLTRLFVEGFGEIWDKNFYLEEFDRKKTAIQFFGEKDWLIEQEKKIKIEMLELAKDPKWNSFKQKVKRVMKKKVSNEEFDETAKWDKLVAGLSLFNIILMVDIIDGE